MKLLILVLQNPDLGADIVPALIELNIRGIFSIESENVMQFLAQEVPIFAGLRGLLTTPKAYNKTFFGITDNDDILKQLYAILKAIDIDLQTPGTGFAITIPVDNAIMESLEE